MAWFASSHARNSYGEVKKIAGRSGVPPGVPIVVVMARVCQNAPIETRSVASELAHRLGMRALATGSLCQDVSHGWIMKAHRRDQNVRHIVAGPFSSSAR